MLNPILFSLLDRYLEKTETIEEQLLEETLEEETQIPVNICGHAIVVGYGRVGRLLCQRLQEKHFPLVAIEDTRARFEELGEIGISAVMGNAAREDIMALARLDCAYALFLTIPNGYEAGKIIESARAIRPDINIIVRAHYDDEVTYLTARGADHIIIGEHEIARAMADSLPESTPACPIALPSSFSPTNSSAA